MKISVKRKIKKYLISVCVILAFVTVLANHDVFAGPVRFVANNFSSSMYPFVLPNCKIKVAQKSAQLNKKEQSTAETVTQSPTQTTSKSGEQTALANGTSTGNRVITQTIDKSGATLSKGDIYIKNQTSKEIDIDTILSNKPNLKITLNSKKPQVLIVHTHATECFFPSLVEHYPADWGERDDDISKNIVEVGKVIAQKLNIAGIKTIQSKVLHDKESYTGAYDRSRETIKYYLKKYPSIKVVIDVHRDAINEEDGDKIRPIVEINNKTASQIMIISGCQSGPITGYPNWRKNLRFSTRLQQKLEQTYPSLARPLFFAEKKYNQDLCENSFLLEVGSQANLLSEAKYSAELFSNVFIDYLKEFS